MKHFKFLKSALLIGILTVSVSVFGQDKVVPYSEVPSQIQTYVKKHFPNSKIIQSEVDYEGLTKINFVAPETDLNKILWNNKKMEAKAANQSLAFNLILYLLGNKVDDEKLLQDYRQILKNDTIDLPERKISPP